MLAEPLPQVAPPRLNQNSELAPKGMNLRDFSAVLKDAGLNLLNLYPIGQGRIRKAPGSSLQFEITTGTDAGTPINASLTIDGNFELITYGNVLAVRDNVEDTETIIKSDFPTDDPFSMVKYGAYAFLCNGSTSIAYVTATLDYDAQTVNFTVGNTIEGVSSGAKARIIADVDGGATGTLTIQMLNNLRFEDDEQIDEIEGSGSADVDGTITFVWTENTNAPKCKVLKVHRSNKLAAGNIVGDNPSKTIVSRVDQLTGVPWANAADWDTTTTNPGDAAEVTFDNGGTVVAFGENSSQLVPLLDQGSLGFRFGQIDVSGTGLQNEITIDYQNTDLGATRGVTVIAEGIIFVNNFGVWLKRPSGRTDERFAMFDEKLSESLGGDFWKDYDTSDSDVVFDHKRDLIIVTARDDSNKNNVQLVYSIKDKLEGWFKWDKLIKRFFEKDDEIYYTSSLSTAIFKLDYGRGDEAGDKISTELSFEPSINSPAGLAALQMFIFGGKFVEGEQIDVEMDTFDYRWRLSKNEVEYTVTAGADNAPKDGMSVSGGMDAITGNEGDDDDGELNQNLFPVLRTTQDFQRIQVRIKTLSRFRQEYNLWDILTIPRGVVGVTGE